MTIHKGRVAMIIIHQYFLSSPQGSQQEESLGSSLLSCHRAETTLQSFLLDDSGRRNVRPGS